MKKRQQKSKIIMWSSLGVVSAFVIFSVLGMSWAINQVAETAISKTPEAILASAGVEDGMDVNLAVVYYDQKQDECVNLYDISSAKELKMRQFEWSSCGYTNRKLEQGMVEFELGDDYLPVAKGGELISNKGMRDISRWFEGKEGKSKGYAGTLNLAYEVNEQAEFVYKNNDFYPLDGVDFSNGDSVNKDRHNHLFTMNFAVPFMVLANGEEAFTIAADDDTFVYVDDKLVLDMGGIHEALAGRFKINENGEVYAGVGDEELAYSGVTIEKDMASVVRIFHADRDAAESTFEVRFSGMNLSVVNSAIAGSDGVQIAYDPNDPSYVAPLGESIVVRPDGTKGYMIMMTVFGALIVVFSIFAAGFAKRMR